MVEQPLPPLQPGCQLPYATIAALRPDSVRAYHTGPGAVGVYWITPERVIGIDAIPTGARWCPVSKLKVWLTTGPNAHLALPAGPATPEAMTLPRLAAKSGAVWLERRDAKTLLVVLQALRFPGFGPFSHTPQLVVIHAYPP